MELSPARLDAVEALGLSGRGDVGEQGREAPCGRLFVHVEDDDEVRIGSLDRDVGNGLDLGDGDPARGALIGEGGGDESIGHDDLASLEGGPDALLDELAS